MVNMRSGKAVDGGKFGWFFFFLEATFIVVYSIQKTQFDLHSPACD